MKNVFKILDPKIQRLIRRRFNKPTEVQKLVIPDILRGKNVLVMAGTGLGKTEAAMLPLFHRLVEKEHKPFSILYINPLRSLSRDLLDRLFWWADKLDLEVALRHGDTTQKERVYQREVPSHLLITTPETLQAILTGKTLKKHLSNVKYVIIDEIHELVGNKRGIQLSIGLERLKELAGDFQRIGLSATIGSPEKVAKFLGKDVKIIEAGGAKEYEIKVEFPKTSSKIPTENLFIGEETAARLMRIYDLIQKHESVLTFTNTRQMSEVLSSRLRNIDKELKQTVHHGSLSKEVRIKSENDFKKQHLKSLICTSSLELGIDIGSIDLVIQYMSPRQATKLIQRVGRSGHRIGEKSKGIVLSGDEDVFEAAVIAKHAEEHKLEQVKIHDMALDVLANQMLGIAMDEYNVSGEKMFNIIKRAYPYRKLKKKTFLDVLKFLGKIRLLWLTPIYDKEKIIDYKIRRSRKGLQSYFENLSTIPDTSQYRVISIVEDEPVGLLDEAFVAEHGESGNKFICSGRAWKILDVEERKVYVEPIDDIESAIPSWEGELMPVPFSVAQDVGRLRRFVSENLKNRNILRKLREEYPIDENSALEIKNLIKKQKRKHVVPDEKTFLIESYKDFVILHSCCGTLVNNTIGKYIAAEITNRTGVSVNIKNDPYRIMFQTLSKAKDVKNILESAEDIKKVLELTLERSSLFKWRFLHVAKRMGIISRKAKYNRVNINRILSQYIGSPAYEETMREIFLEKMDVKTTEEIIDKIRQGEIKIVVQKGLSPLGENGLVQQFSEVMKPRRPEKEIFNAFKKRLMHTSVRLVCTNCGDYSVAKAIKNMEEHPTCPKCKSGMIGVFSKYKKKPLEILKKHKAKKQLTKDEKKELENIKRSASLMITYGKRYAMTQAGRGVGVEIAARILAQLPKDEETLLKLIFKAEKDFLRTKRYWK
jgi:ATP-dependent Lhr-like helicase